MTNVASTTFSSESWALSPPTSSLAETRHIGPEHEDALRRLRWTHKNKSLAESLRDEAARAAWREEVSHLDARQLVFVEESSTPVALTPLYAWAPKGQRACVPGATQPGQNHYQAFCHHPGRHPGAPLPLKEAQMPSLLQPPCVRGWPRPSSRETRDP